jgi:hypothetical protein
VCARFVEVSGREVGDGLFWWGRLSNVTGERKARPKPHVRDATCASFIVICFLPRLCCLR